jgi:hypothetical protein
MVGIMSGRQLTSEGTLDLYGGGAGGRNRTDTPFGNGILSAARLPVPPRPHACDGPIDENRLGHNPYSHQSFESDAA